MGLGSTERVHRELLAFDTRWLYIVFAGCRLVMGQPAPLALGAIFCKIKTVMGFFPHLPISTGFFQCPSLGLALIIQPNQVTPGALQALHLAHIPMMAATL